MLGLLIQVAKVGAFVSAGTFPALYTLGRYRGLWYRSPEGRQLVAAYSVFTVLLGLGVVGVFAGPWWTHWAGRPYLALAAYLALIVVFVWQSVLVVLARTREARRRSSIQT